MTALTFIGCDGTCHEATLVRLRDRGRAEIDVHMPGNKEPFRLTTVGWRDHPTAETFVAWPREQG